MWRLLLFFLIYGAVGKKQEPQNSKLIMFLIDGCRWDYVNDPDLKGFQKLAENGVKAKYVQPVFPSSSYPNGYSVVTGLYPESHGFVQNILYDDQRQEFFYMIPNPNSTNPHWWEQAEPIWVTTEKAGILTAMYWYVGCEVIIHGIQPMICLKHRYTAGGENITRDILNKVDDALDRFGRNEIRFAMFYYGALDKTGHEKGPDSPERKQALFEIDKVFYELQDRISQRGLSDEVSIVVTADHGMTSTDTDEISIISLEPFADDIKYAMPSGPVTAILPKQGRLNKLYDDLKNANIKGLKVFKKEEIPDRFHIKNNKYTLPLLLVARKGYYIKKLVDPEKSRSNSTGIAKGSHGYDPDEVEDMKTIFYALGPTLKKGYISPPVENVDHYNLMCNILNLKPLPNNGSWSRIKDMFISSRSAQFSAGSSVYIISFVTLYILTSYILG